MTPFRIGLVIFFTAVLSLLFFRETQSKVEHVVRIAVPLKGDHATSKSLLTFQRELESKSGGTMQVEIYLNSQLGSADETLNLTRTGDVQMVVISSAVLSPYVPEVNAVALPFVWESSEHQERAMSGVVGDRIREYARDAIDIEILGYFDAGTRNITTVRGPIEKPEDMRGMKIRVMSQPLMIATIDALGGSATSLNMGEVYTALQMGVVDGWENNPTTVADYKMWEAHALYFAWTNHFSLPDLLVAGGPFMESLNDEQRRWVAEAAEATVRVQRETWQASEEKALERMVEAGMKINEVDMSAFRNRVHPLYEQYFDRYGDNLRELVELIQEMK